MGRFPAVSLVKQSHGEPQVYLIREDDKLPYWQAIEQQIQSAKVEQAKQRTIERSSRKKPRAKLKKRRGHSRKYLVKLASENRLRFLHCADARDSEAYKAWRMAVLRRDGFRCVKCHSKQKLHVHHCFAGYADDPHRRLDVDNGVTVCSKCHAEIHPWMKK